MGRHLKCTPFTLEKKREAYDIRKELDRSILKFLTFLKEEGDKEIIAIFMNVVIIIIIIVPIQ